VSEKRLKPLVWGPVAPRDEGEIRLSLFEHQGSIREARSERHLPFLVSLRQLRGQDPGSLDHQRTSKVGLDFFVRADSAKLSKADPSFLRSTPF